MPRKSAAALSTVAVLPEVAKRRLRPPDNLPAEAKKHWIQVVDTLPADRFHASDAPLLALYVRTLARADEALDEIDRIGPLDHQGRPNPFHKILESTAKMAAVLATKLRVCPQSRLDRKVAGPAARFDESGPKLWDRRPWEKPAASDESD